MTPKEREVMQMALTLLENLSEQKTVQRQYGYEVINSLRELLSKPEQEPVALGDSSYDVDFRDDGTISVSLPDGDELVIVPPQPKQKDLEPYCYTWDKWISSGTWEAQYGWKPYYGGKRPEHVTDAKPLYTALQREWIGLTDEEIDEVAWPHFIGNIMPSVKIIVRQLEAKLKEKNT